MKPALTPEEWAIAIPWDKEGIIPSYLTLDIKHSMAAVCLHEQPFGFTEQDVKDLRRLAREASWNGHDDVICDQLADRIEALLPPT